jgi:hypothetical protein
MSALRKLDDWIIETMFQPIADWSNDRFGISGVRIGAVCLLLMVCTGLVEKILLGLHSPLDATLTGLGAVVMIWIASYLYTVLHARERRESMIRSTINKLRSLWGTRMVCLFFVVLNTPKHIGEATAGEFTLQVHGWVGLTIGVLIFIFQYFIACTTKPPKPKKATGSKLAYQGSRS